MSREKIFNIALLINIFAIAFALGPGEEMLIKANIHPGFVLIFATALPIIAVSFNKRATEVLKIIKEFIRQLTVVCLILVCGVTLLLILNDILDAESKRQLAKAVAFIGNSLILLLLIIVGTALGAVFGFFQGIFKK